MKKMICLLLLLGVCILTGCESSHYYAEDMKGDKVLVQNVDAGSPCYYPPMFLWNVGIAFPVTAAEFYGSAAVFVPVILLTDNGKFVGWDEGPSKCMTWVFIDHHPPFLPFSAVDYELGKEGIASLKYKAACEKDYKGKIVTSFSAAER